MYTYSICVYVKADASIYYISGKVEYRGVIYVLGKRKITKEKQ